MESSHAVIDLKQRIASVYSLLGDRFPEFPKARETWYKLAEGERFQCQVLRRLAENVDLGRDEPRLESLATVLEALEKQAQSPQPRLEEGYQISLDLSSVELEVMAHLVEQVEFPQSLEIKNIASVMSTNLLNLYDMMEKSMAALALHGAVSKTRLHLLSLNLLFLEFDMRNYLTGVMGMSRMLLAESAGGEMKRLLDEIYQYCDTVRGAMKELERIRLHMTQSKEG